MNTKHRNLNTPASGNSFPIGLILIRMQSMRGLPSSLSSSYLPLRPSRLISSIYLSRLHSLPSPEIIVHHRLTLYYVWTCLNVLFSSLSCLLPSSCWLRETMACAIQIKKCGWCVRTHQGRNGSWLQRATRQMEGGKKEEAN